MKHIKVLLLVLGLVFSLSACELSDQVNIVDVKESSVSIGIGQSYTLEVVVSSDAATYLQFLSDNTEVATVSNDGVITGISKGVTAIQVRAGNGFDYVTVRVAGGVLEDASSGDSEDVYIVTTEAEFLEALNEGIYQITLGADITISTEIALSYPFEIIHQGFVLDVDFSFNDDFYGALAFYQDEETRGPNNAFAGNIDMGERIKPVRIFRHNMTVSYDWLNTYNMSYDVVLDYQDLGDYIPIFTMDDFLKISSETEHVFALGTPYQKAYTSTGNLEEFVLITHITGEASYMSDYYVLYFDIEKKVRLYDTSWNFVESLDTSEFNKNPRYRYAFNQDVTVDDVSQTILDGLSETPSQVLRYHHMSFERPSSRISSVNLITVYGNNHNIQYFDFSRELFAEVSNSKFYEITMKDIYADLDDDSLFVEHTAGEFNWFIHIDFDTVYVLMIDDEDEYGLLIGDNEASYTLISGVSFNNVFIETDHEKIGLLIGYSDQSLLDVHYIRVNDVYMKTEEDSNGVLIGEIYQGDTVISDVSFRNIEVNAGDRNVGLLVGHVLEANVHVSEINVYNALFRINNDYNMGGFFGFIEHSNVEANQLNVYQLTMTSNGISSYNIGVVVGSVSDSVIDLKNIYTDLVDITGYDNIGGVIGDSARSVITLSNVDNRMLTINGANRLSSVLGSVRESTIVMNDVSISNSSVTGDNYIGGVIGSMNNTSLQATHIDIKFTDLISDFNAGFVVGFADDATLYLELTRIDTNTLSALNSGGGLVGLLNHSTLEVQRAKLLSNTVTIGTIYGGLVGVVRQSTIQGYVESIDMDFTQSFENETLKAGRLFGDIATYYIDLILNSVSTTEIAGSLFLLEEVEDSPYVGVYDVYDNYFMVRFLSR